MLGKTSIKKILLLSPPSIVKQSWSEDVGSFPLGLAYIAAVLKQNNFEVEILDCFIEGFFNRQKMDNQLMRIGMSDDEIIETVIRRAPDLIGISIPFSCQISSALHINSLIKKINRDIITVAGGNHVNAAPKSIGHNTFDWIIIGEGEYQLLNLIKAINNKNTRNGSINAICVSDGISDNHVNTKTDFIEDLDSLPFPQYRLLSLEKYWNARGGRRWINMIATRGCPYNCVFCSIHTIMGRKVRYRSVNNVLKEIAFLKQEFGIEQIFFEDDNLTSNMKWAKELFNKILQENFGLEIFFRNGIRADRVDLELLKLMKRAGVKRVWFAPESGSQKTLDNIIKKKMRLEDCENAIRMAKNVGLDVTCFLVIGFPEETMEDVKQTINYGRKLKKLGCNSIWISCAVPYPGTELFANCVKRGIISGENIDYQRLSTMDSVIHNEYFTAKELKQIRDQAMHQLNRRGLKDIFKAIQRTLMLFVSDPLLLLKRFCRKISLN